MSTQFDVIVVGGGHNGLVCANYLAGAGLTVCVLESHERVGGACITEEFHPGFRNSTASYTVSLLQGRIIADLDLAAHGLRILPRPLHNFVPSLTGAGLKLPGSLDSRLAAIAAHSRRDAERYAGFAAELEAVTRWVKPLLLEAPVEPLAGVAEIRRGLGHAWRLRHLTRRQRQAARALLTGSAGHWLERHFECDLLKGGLGFDAVVGHFASPYQSGSGYLLLHHALGEVNGETGSWGHAVGGMGSIADALAAAAVSRGVAIRVGQPVKRIARERARFSVWAGGDVYTATRVAASVHPQTLFLQLLKDEPLPRKFLQRIRAWKSESASFRLNVALAELPDFTCLPGRSAAEHHGAGILIAPSLAYLEQAYHAASATGWSPEPVIELLIPSTLDRSLAPPGTHVASLFCQHFRPHLPAEGSWALAKDTAVRAIIAAVTRFAPNFGRSILALQAFSPEDLERRFGLIGGDIFHGVMSRDQLYWSRPARRYAQYRSPIPALYLCGSGSHPGGGVSGAPGYNAAQAILGDLRATSRSR